MAQIGVLESDRFYFLFGDRSQDTWWVHPLVINPIELVKARSWWVNLLVVDVVDPVKARSWWVNPLVIYIDVSL